MTAQRSEIEIPQLSFVSVADLVLHEQHDASRSAPLSERLRRDGMLKNPPIVAAIPGDGRFVVLDGANRTTALRQLGVPHVVVQVVDYTDPDLALDTWHHLVAEIPTPEFAQAAQKITGISFQPGDLLRARAALARRDALVYVVFPDGMVLIARGESDLHERAALLNALVDVYRFRSRIYRVSTDQIEQVLPYYQNVTALIVFPRYQPSEILELARNSARLPAGITRHVIPRRALRLNIPVSMLLDPRSLTEKNEWLTAWMRKKLTDKQIRFYQESTWLFVE
jgi:hypothetical protein